MDRLRSAGLKWGFAAVYLLLCLSLVLLFPDWLRPVIVVAYLLYALWNYLTLETDFGQSVPIRPLTRWDVPNMSGFREELTRACEAAGLRREPIWAVMYDEQPNAMALGGRRGLVVFTTQLLRTFPPAEILAVAGHELNHLASRDSLPPVLGGTLLHLVGTLSAYVQEAGEVTRGTFAAPFLLVVSLLLDVSLRVVGWVAHAFLARRSRFQEHQADLAGARLSSAAAMISALDRLEQVSGRRDRPAVAKWSPAWIAQELHASHPPTKERIAYLQQAAERGELSA